MKLAIIIGIVALLLLGGCTSKAKINAAVEERTATLNQELETAKTQVATLEQEKTALIAERDQAIGEKLALNETVIGLETALDDNTQKAEECWTERDQLEDQRLNLTKKNDVLQGWVDVCKETLDMMG